MPRWLRWVLAAVAGLIALALTNYIMMMVFGPNVFVKIVSIFVAVFSAMLIRPKSA
jgi:uncharacterized membrane protein YjjP (DUF1212 family)